jgi:LytS/YehU family sensor histidine kinase
MVISGVPNCSDCDWVPQFFWYLIIPVLLLHLHWFYRCIHIVRAGFTPQNQLNFLELMVVPFLVLVYFLFEFSSNSSIEVTVFNFIAVHVIGVGSAYLRSIFAAEQRSFLTEVTQSSAELGALRAQINPHFLFNALNTLYAIAMKENSEKTADGIQKLGDMMRFMLHENHQNRIPLAKEIEYLHNLISIQELRLDENQQIELKVNLQNPDRDVFIAPMLLNPFVENAFKHGISFRNPSWIYITLTHDPEHIFFKVHNSYHPKAENELDPEKDSHGIGLDNVRKRLDLLYPDKHELSIQVSEHDYFVSLILTIV